MTSVSTNGNSAHPTILNPEEFDLRFGPVAEEWRTQDGMDLTIRHKTGKLLNEFMGPPTTRTKRGEGVAAKAAGRLGITKSEISRVRWFAHFFGSVEDLKGKYSGAASWTTVKVLIPELKREAKPHSPAKEGGHGGDPASGTADKMKNRKSKQMEHHLKGFSEAFIEVHNHLNRVELHDLENKVSGVLDKVRTTYFQRGSDNVRVDANGLKSVG